MEKPVAVVVVISSPARPGEGERKKGRKRGECGAGLCFSLRVRAFIAKGPWEVRSNQPVEECSTLSTRISEDSTPQLAPSSHSFRLRSSGGELECGIHSALPLAGAADEVGRKRPPATAAREYERSAVLLIIIMATWCARGFVVREDMTS